MGNEALSIVDLLPYYLFGMICFGLSSLIITYDQSKKRYLSSAISGLSIVAVVGGIVLFHSSIYEISTVMTLVGIFCLVLNVSGMGISATKARFQRRHSQSMYTKIVKRLRAVSPLESKLRRLLLKL